MAFKDNILPFTVFLATAAVLVVIRTSTHPSLTRDWQPNQKTLTSIEINGDDVFMRNIRSTRYQSETNFVPTYFDHDYKLSDLEQACLIIEDLGGMGRAHVMLSFEFHGQGWVVFSPEPRLENGEEFSAVAGLFRRYELATLVAAESDAVYLRTNILHHPVYMYDFRLDEAQLRMMFLEMVSRETSLSRDPEFYHTIFNSGSGQVMHVMRSVAKHSSPGPLFMPIHADRRAYEMRLLRTDVSINILHGQGMITDDVRGSQAGDADFSDKIHKAVGQIQEGL